MNNIVSLSSEDSLLECIQQLLNSPSEDQDLPAGYSLNPEYLSRIRYNISSVSNPKEIQTKILPFFKDAKSKSKQEVLLILELLEFLYGINFVPVRQALCHPQIIDFLLKSASHKARDVKRKALYLVFYISNKLRDSKELIDPMMDLKKKILFNKDLNKDLMKEALDGQNTESPYFATNKDSRPLSPTKHYTSRFQGLWDKQEMPNNLQKIRVIKPWDNVVFPTEPQGKHASIETNLQQRQPERHIDSISGSNCATENEQRHEARQGVFSDKLTNGSKQGTAKPVKPSNNTEEKISKTIDLGRNNIHDEQNAPTYQNKRNGLQVNTSRPNEYPKAYTQYNQQPLIGNKHANQNAPPHSPLKSGSTNIDNCASPTGIDFVNQMNLDQAKLNGILSMQDLLDYKRKDCVQRNCTYRGFVGTQEEFLSDNNHAVMCPGFHDSSDQRRFPLHKQNYMQSFYKHDLLCNDCFNDSKTHKGRCYYCRNWFEVYYHPKNYKLAKCTSKICNQNPLRRQYCPCYHSQQERDTWDQLLLEKFNYDRKAMISDVKVGINGINHGVGTTISPYLNSPSRKHEPHRQYQATNTIHMQPLDQDSSPTRVANINSPGIYSINHSDNRSTQPYNNQQVAFSTESQNQAPRRNSYYKANTDLFQDNKQLQEGAAKRSSFTIISKSDKEGQTSKNQSQNQKQEGDSVQQQSSSQQNDVQILQSLHPHTQPLSQTQLQSQAQPVIKEISPDVAAYLTEETQDSVPKKPLRLDAGPKQPNYYLKDDLLQLDGPGLEENKRVEFKHFKGPSFSDMQWGIIVKTIGGFLNAEGGKLFIGVDDFGTVAGTRMSYKDYDTFKGDLISSMLSYVSPSVDDHLFSIKRIPVVQDPADAKRPQEWKFILIEITVLPSEGKVYFVREGQKNLVCYQRYDGSTRMLRGEQMNELFARKLRK